MGFDMYHAMSAEQEAKAALNRPMPIPLARRTGSEPAKVLDGGGGGGGGGGGTTSGSSPATAGPSGWRTVERSGRRWRSGAGGAAGGAAAAGGAVAAGVVVAKEAAAAGPRLGELRRCRRRPARPRRHESAAPSTVPPPVADSTLADTAGKK